MRSMTWLAGLGLFSLLGTYRPGAQVAQSGTTFEVVEKARICTPSHADVRQVDCDFRVGRSLWFSIAGVGLPDAGIAFMKSDIEGDYYGAVGLEHHCVIVWPGKLTTNGQQKRIADLAFVSPIDGRVYRNWRSCQAAK